MKAAIAQALSTGQLIIFKGRPFVVARLNGTWVCSRNAQVHIGATASEALDGWMELYGDMAAA